MGTKLPGGRTRRRDHRFMAGKGRSPRVIAGEAGGRRLAVPGGSRLRPTSDRVKESLFSALGPRRIEGARVLDLFAGTGALGIEALSRGADRALFVDRDRSAVEAIVANLEATGLGGRARVERGDAAVLVTGPAPAEGPFDLAFLDPPYDLGDEALASVLGRLLDGDWMAPGATVVVERAAGAALGRLPPGWGSTWERCYGDTLLWFLEAKWEERVEWPPH